MIRKNKGEMWHLYKILDCIETPQTQNDINLATRLNNYTLRREYLTKLKKLDFIQRIEARYDGIKQRNHKAILWKITPKGREFKKIINQYVSLGLDLQ